jgi:hypothetical protein
LKPIHKAPDDVYGVFGTNKVVEVAGEPFTHVALAANIPPSTMTVTGGSSQTVYAIQAVVTSLNSSDVAKDALAALAAASPFATISTLWAGHTAAWVRDPLPLPVQLTSTVNRFFLLCSMDIRRRGAQALLQLSSGYTTRTLLLELTSTLSY